MQEIRFIEKTVRNAYKKCILNAKRDVMLKEHDFCSYDFATSCDISVETYIANHIKKRYPNDNIVGEENFHDNAVTGRTWIIDPIDGTINFYYDLPMWCIQLAFVENGECKFSIIYCPIENLMYIADSRGARLNGRPLTLNTHIPTNQAIVNICDPLQNDKKLLGLQHALYKCLTPKVSKVKMIGSAGYEFACVASNRVHAYVVITNNIWDYLPGEYLCRQAGCAMIEREVCNTKLYVACANAEIKELIEKEIDKYFK